MLIIGAGPAGSAAAISLARRGVDVLLIDMRQFPRDKICGDALIPDALAALDTLGVRDTVCARARQLKGVKIYAPNGRAVVLNGDCAVVPRGVFDDTLRVAAIQSGVRFMAPYRAVDPIGADRRVDGATLRHATDGHRLDVDAQWTILASGAAGEVLRTFRVAQRVDASATAGRVYMRVPQSVASDLPFLLISFDRQITPGYGWVFPGPGNVLNVGVGARVSADRQLSGVESERGLVRPFATGGAVQRNDGTQTPLFRTGSIPRNIFLTTNHHLPPTAYQPPASHTLGRTCR